MTANEQEMLEAIRDAVRWLDAIEQHLGGKMVSLMPNNCLGRPGMRQIITRMRCCAEWPECSNTLAIYEKAKL